MEKQEILEKSRRENQKGDERGADHPHGGGVLQPALRVFDGPDSADLEAGPWGCRMRMC